MGGAANASADCVHVWDNVVPGVPALAPSGMTVSDGSADGLRASLMASHSRDAPVVCLQPDDYEALLTLYPPCTAMPTTPSCDKAPRNLGLLRLAAGTLVPAVVCLLLATCLQLSARARLRSLEEQTHGGMGTTATSLLKRAAGLGSSNRIVPVDGSVDAGRTGAPPTAAVERDAAAGAIGDARAEGTGVVARSPLVSMAAAERRYMPESEAPPVAAE